MTALFALWLLSGCTHAPPQRRNFSTSVTRLRALTIDDFEHGFLYGSELQTVAKPEEMIGSWLLVGTYCRNSEGKPYREVNLRGVDISAQKYHFDIDRDNFCPAPFFRMKVVPDKGWKKVKTHYYSSDGTEDRQDHPSFGGVPAAFENNGESNYWRHPIREWVSDPCFAFFSVNGHAFMVMHKERCEN